jgi:hypothetical protein
MLPHHSGLFAALDEYRRCFGLLGQHLSTLLRSIIHKYGKPTRFYVGCSLRGLRQIILGRLSIIYHRNQIHRATNACLGRGSQLSNHLRVFEGSSSLLPFGAAQARGLMILSHDSLGLLIEQL